MRRILITGGLGYVGSHICLLFLELGYEIIAFDLLINSEYQMFNNIINLIRHENPKLESNFNFIRGDIRDEQILSEIFLDNKNKGKVIDGVIHLAGLKSVKESILKPVLYWDFNVKGTINLLKVMHNNNCKNIIFSSSATVYGNSEKKLLDEKSYLNPKNTYGRTKLAIENMLHDLHLNHKEWNVGILRYFNPAGAHPSGEIGEKPVLKTQNLFPKICDVAFKKKKKISIYGKNWPTIDGSCIRDYIHIMDLAEAHYYMYEYIKTNKCFEILNVGNGFGTTVLELINEFEKANNCQIPYEFKDIRVGDVSNLVADISLIKSKLNWLPKKNIYQICRSAWHFYEKDLIKSNKTL